MIIPSVAEILRSWKVTPRTATGIQLRKAVVEAIKIDLSLGYKIIEEGVKELKGNAGSQITMKPDMDSEAGKQYIQLLTTDITKGVLEKYFKVTFGFSCCKGVIKEQRCSI